METLKIRNWDKWQRYRKGRGQPSWIMVHRSLMRDPNWVELTDAQRGQLVAMWMLAADRHGTIPSHPRTIQKLCFMDDDPDLQVFVDKGFIEAGANVSPTCHHPGANPSPDWCQPDTPEEKRKEEKRIEKKGAKAPLVFEGMVIKLNEKDHALWKQTFFHVELDAYLVSRDQFLADLPADDNRRLKWMVSTSADLRNKNHIAKAERKPNGSNGKLQFRPELPKISKEEWRGLRDDPSSQ